MTSNMIMWGVQPNFYSGPDSSLNITFKMLSGYLLIRPLVNSPCVSASTSPPGFCLMERVEAVVSKVISYPLSLLLSLFIGTSVRYNLAKFWVLRQNSKNLDSGYIQTWPWSPYLEVSTLKQFAGFENVCKLVFFFFLKQNFL